MTRHNRLWLVGVFVTLALILPCVAQHAGAATTRYWDTNGTTAGFGVGGTYDWSDGTQKWNTSSNGGSGALGGWASGDTGEFNGNGASTITVNSAVTAAAVHLGISPTSGSTTTLNFSGASPLTITGYFGVGWQTAAAASTAAAVFNQTGGTISAGSGIEVGRFGANGTYSLSDGTVTAALLRIANNVQGAGAGTVAPSGSVTISGGAMTINGPAYVGAVGKNASILGTGTLTISDTGLFDGQQIQFGYATSGYVNGTVNLNGGTLKTTSFVKGSGTSITSTLNFNGGTLQAKGDSPSFLTGLTSAYVKTGGAIIDDGGYSITIGQPLLADTVSLGGGLTKKGAGTLTLSGVNIFTGNLSVQAGALAVDTVHDSGTSGPLGSSTTPVTLGNAGGLTGTLQYTGATAATNRNFTMAAGGAGAFQVDNADTDLTVSGAIDGSGALRKTGAGTLTLSATNSFTGATTINGGTLVLSTAGSTNNIATSSTITVRSGATLNVAGLSGGGIAVGSSQTLSGAGTVSGAVTTVSGSTLVPGSTTTIGTLATGSLSLAAGANLTYRFGTPGAGLASPGTGSAVNVSGDLSLPPNAVNLNILDNMDANSQGSLGNGYYVLFNYSGNLSGDPTTAFAPGSGARTYSYYTPATGANPGQIAVRISTLTLTWTGQTGGTGVNDSGWNLASTNWSNNATSTAASYVDGAMVSFQDANPLNAPNNVTNSTIALDATFSPASVTFSNSAVNYTLSGSGGIATRMAKTGTGTLFLQNANSFTGPVTISAGAVNISNPGALGNSSGVTVADGAALQIRGGITTAGEVPLAISGAGLAASPAGALSNVSGDNTYTGPITLTAPSTIALAAGSLTLSGAITGPYDLTIAGLGTVTLANATANSYGATVINNGTTLRIGDSDASGGLGTGTVTNNGSVVFHRSDTALTVANDISGSGSITQSGPGAVTLSGANTYTGKTTVAGGSLAFNTIGNISALSSALGAPTTVADGTIDLSGTLVFTGDLYADSDRIIHLTGPGTVANNGPGVLSLTGGVAGSSDVTFRGAGNIDQSGVIAAANLVHTDGGTLTLTNPGNSFNGFHVAAGAVIADSIADSGVNSAIGAGSQIRLGQDFAGAAGSGVFRFSGSFGGSTNRAILVNNGPTGGSGVIENTVGGQRLTLSGNVTAADNASASALTLAGAGDGLLSGSVTGSPNMGLTKAGAGTWTLSGTCTYTGSTTINGGALALSGDNRLPSATTVSFSGNGTLDVGSSSQSVANLTMINNNVMGTVTGSGGTLSVMGGSVLVGGTAAGTSQTLDLSGLTTFSYNNPSGTFQVAGAATSTASGGASGMVTLAATSAITAASFNVGGFYAQPSSNNTGTANLGTNNTINANTIQLGNYRNSGTLQYAAVTDPTLTIRGTDGVSRVTTMNVGISSGPITAVQGTVDLTSYVMGASTLDARIDNLTIGCNARASNAGGNPMKVTGAFLMGGGTLDATTITIGQNLAGFTNGGTASYTNGTLTVDGGTVKVDTLYLADQQVSITDPITATFNLNSGANLYARLIAPGTGAGTAAATRIFNWNDGTIRNYSADTDLTISAGPTWTLASSGAHIFFIDTERQGSVAAVLAGDGGAVVKDGTGTLTLIAANTYSGGTTVNAGTLTVSSAATLGSGTGDLAVNNPNATGAGTDVVLNLNSPQTIGSLSGAISTPIRGTNAARINLLGDAATVLAVNQGTEATYMGALSGPGGLTKSGLATLTLSGVNTYTGGTKVNEGTLRIERVGALPAGAALTIGAGGTVVLSGGLSAGAAGAGTPHAAAAPVPEPGTVLLLAVALAGLALAGWRRGR